MKRKKHHRKHRRHHRRERGILKHHKVLGLTMRSPLKLL